MSVKSTTSPTSPTSERVSARERLLAAANDLFYDEGVHTVGIDRVIERAGVAKATLYSAFGSKDELIAAYLRGRHAMTKQRITRGLEAFDTPRDRLVGLFDVQGDLFVRPEFRGCAFVGASAETPRGGVVELVSDEYRAWLRQLLHDLAEEAGAREPDRLAHQLHVIYDGSTLGAWMDRDPSTARAARATAEAIVDAALDG
jgi:AcrR family transcriptional regulator